MSSIKQVLRKQARESRGYGRPTLNPAIRMEDYESVVKEVGQEAADPLIPTINIQAVLDDLFTDIPDGKTLELRADDFLAVTPGHPYLWLEGRLPLPAGEMPLAFLVKRLEGEIGVPLQYPDAPEPIRWSVLAYFFEMAQGLAVLSSMISLAVGASGQVHGLGCLAMAITPRTDSPERDKSWHQLITLALGHSLSRMNCANVVLESIDSHARVRGDGTEPIPACVWHRIVVASVPKIRHAAAGSEVADDGQYRKLRAQRIRGHYRDYRHGKGLFGREKLRRVFWIPEFEVGDPKYGVVIPEYVVQ